MTTAVFPLGDLGAVQDHLAAADPDRTLVPCGISAVLLGRDRIGRVADAVAGLLDDRPATDGRRPTVLLLVDATPIQRLGDDLKTAVRTSLEQRFDVRTEVLTDEHPVLHADEAALDTASRAAQGVDAIVSVGGGTVTDIGKVASVNAGGVPHAAVQTAASVDGFTDDVSVVLRAGVKRTIASRWPDVVIADVETISEAPARMNRAGFGEITSMFTAPADWRLGALLQVDPTFHPAPTQLLDAVGADIDEWAPGVAVADPAAVERLTWALAVRGIATGVSGTTAVLSGVEHLVSHMLDLHHGEHGLPMGLHGAQVGAAAVIAAAAWELLFDRMAQGAPAVRIPDSDVARARVESAFGHLGSQVTAECWSDYSRKLATWAAHRPAVEAAVADWGRVEPELRRLLRPSADIAAQLRAAGAAALLADLDPSVDPALAHWAVANCALMRNRSTVVDLLVALGWWGADDAAEVLVRADRAATGARPGVR
ncbi:iron-containing alcohol dehydrogenase [Geodermatophilus sp. DSM 45219]|uniref:iron-containing alcohol dehydrogenase n=1 Tax=Geodermatophilus sp. DSM 45219 TaxID=1881103 RepID=UPI0008878181|nr:iron-containing alcohol dehydrogenase [Geodermatophilus sp. DSM 45219]SDN94320.1 glycerol-1-phosphate dehydrogenase [NAD(P)+] [Geodermatophilus sp. DSM 45219]